MANQKLILEKESQIMKLFQQKYPALKKKIFLYLKRKLCRYFRSRYVNIIFESGPAEFPSKDPNQAELV